MKATWQKCTASLLAAMLVLGTVLAGSSAFASAVSTDQSQAAASVDSENQAVTMTLNAPETVTAGSSFDVVYTLGGLAELTNSIYVMQMDVTYPEGLTCTEVVPGENIKGTLTSGIHNDQHKTTVVYDCDELEGLPKDVSSLFTAKFAADAEMEEGNYSIEMSDVLAFSSDYEEIDSTLENASLQIVHQVAPEKADLSVTFNAQSAQLWIDGEAQKLANLLGSYTQEGVENGADLAFDFVPTAEGRTFRSVSINGGEPEIIGKDSYAYTGKMDTLNPSLSFAFETVSKTTLGAVIDYAQARIDAGDTANLVPTVKKKFEKAFDAATKVYEDPKATQAEINDAWSDLMDAIHYLEFQEGDKTKLEDLIEIAETLSEEDYTADTWTAVVEALEEAKATASDEDAVQNDIDASYESLYKAMKALESVADRSMLETVIARAETIDLDQYFDDGKEDFTKALEDAKALGTDATQKQVDAAATALSEAMANLRKYPSIEELEALLEQMESKDLSGYTAASAAAFIAAKNNLAAALANPAATPEELAAVQDGAIQADKNLKTRTNSSSKGSSSGGSGKAHKPVGAYGESGTAVVSPVVTAAQAVAEQASVRSDTTLPFTMVKGSAYCFKMTVVNSDATPVFTVGDGSVLKTQFVAKIGNDYYFRVYATGKPGQGTGVYTTLPGQQPQRHCTVTVC